MGSVITVNTVFHLVWDNIAFKISRPDYYRMFNA